MTGYSLWDSLNASGRLSGRWLRSSEGSVALDDLLKGSSLGRPPNGLCGSSVLVATGEQLATALSLIELDGLVRRLVLCPPDLDPAHLPYVASAAAVDTVVSERGAPAAALAGVRHLTCDANVRRHDSDRRAVFETEWILFTSGTTGKPKMVLHTLASLTGAIEQKDMREAPRVWSTFYDIRRYGGLQILLRALLDGGSLALSSAHETVGEFLKRAVACGVTHISGTPSHWRRALMSPLIRGFAPQYIRLSGEIVDQPILDNLRAAFEHARLVHAFASTEAGVGFEVRDGLAGFPESFIGRCGETEIRVEDGSLRIRSARRALRYLADPGETLADGDGFVDTRDIVELRGGRYYFTGRGDGIINVGGLKISPEEIEAVINRHPGVRMSLVKARRNPITGAIVIADVVAGADVARDPNSSAAASLKRGILDACRDALASHKVPAAIYFVESLDLNASGKLVRH